MPIFPTATSENPKRASHCVQATADLRLGACRSNTRMPKSASWKFSLNGKAPANFKIELFVIRVGDWGGYMMLDCDDPAAVHKFCSLLPAFVFEARPVIPIEDAVRVELESIAFRDGLKAK